MIAEYQVYETDVYTKWFASLKDEMAKARIDKRIDRAKYGNFGDWKTEAGEIRAMRVNYGPGYRLYYVIRDNSLIILLCGGDKRNQEADIKKAANLAQEVKNGFEA
jgi:putative addiction module killer protein